VNERILQELAPQVLAAVTRRLGRFDLAEDATQEALIAPRSSGRLRACRTIRTAG
jgi:predicted RNA polymerase sigma factor